MRHCFALLICLACALPLSSHAETPDWRSYNQLLEKHVTTRDVNGITLNWVNYSALGNDVLFEQLISEVQNFSTEKLASRAERLSFFINLYNIYAIKMIIDNWPLESIKDASSFFKPVWKKPVGVLNGAMTTLHEIEHEILRKLDEPRIHMAIVCASLSCPDLRKQAFTAADIDAELEQVTSQFLANPAKGFSIDGDAIAISKIFDWFDEDFQPDVTGFLQRYVELPDDSPTIRYMNYDWSLNGE